MKKLSYKLFFDALSNKTRLEIINILKKKSLSVSDICTNTKFEQSRVSHALKCLAQCGFVMVKPNGKQRIYSLNKKTIFPMLRLLESHVSEFEKQLQTCEVLNK